MNDLTIISTEAEAKDEGDLHTGVKQTDYGWKIAYYFRDDEGELHQDLYAGDVELTEVQIKRLHELAHKDDLCSLRAVCEAVAKSPYPDSDPVSLLETLRVQARQALEDYQDDLPTAPQPVRAEYRTQQEWPGIVCPP